MRCTGPTSQTPTQPATFPPPKAAQQAHTRVFLVHEADAFDGPKLLKLPPQLALGHLE